MSEKGRKENFYRDMSRLGHGQKAVNVWETAWQGAHGCLYISQPSSGLEILACIIPLVPVSVSYY